MYSKNNFLKSILFLIAIVATSITGMAQGKVKERIRERVKSQKVAFITEKLDLSESESQKFWPIYNDYQDDLASLKESLDLNIHKDMTDKEAETMMYTILDGRSKEIDIQRKYIQKMKTAIPSRKIALLFKVEKEFRQELISRVKERRNK